MITHKQLARKEGVSLVTIYKRYPVERVQVTQVDVLLLSLHNYSIREIANILGIDKMKVWRLLNNG